MRTVNAVQIDAFTGKHFTHTCTHPGNVAVSIATWRYSNLSRKAQFNPRKVINVPAKLRILANSNFSLVKRLLMSR